MINSKLNMCRLVTKHHTRNKEYELLHIEIQYYEILINELYPLINIKLLNVFGESTQQLSLKLIRLFYYNKNKNNIYNLYTILKGISKYDSNTLNLNCYMETYIKEYGIYILSVLVNQLDVKIKEGLFTHIMNIDTSSPLYKKRSEIIEYLKLNTNDSGIRYLIDYVNNN